MPYSQNWGTPFHIKKRFEDYFDPCPFPKPAWDGLKIEWKNKNFVNPPYNEIVKWAQKCCEEFKKGRECVLLIPSRTDTRYFHDFIIPYAKIEFIKGRLRFVDLNGSSGGNGKAPFASIFCHYLPSH